MFAQSLTLPIRMICMLAVVSVMFTAPATVQAQQLERRDTVAERTRPKLDADGVPVGAMRLYPELAAEWRYDDNIFADDAMKQSDTLIRAIPELRLSSRSPRHRAELGGNLDVARYADFGSEDYEDLRLWAVGDRAVRNGRIQGELKFSDIHEDRTSPDDARGTELTRFSQNSIYGAYTHQPGKLLIRVDGRYRTVDFSSTQTATGVIDNNDRDRKTVDVGLRGGFEMSPDYAVYAEGRFDKIDYDQSFDRNGFQRSSDGVEVRLGTLLDFSGRTQGEFFVGYLRRDYDDTRFSVVNGPSFGGEIAWNASHLTTLTFGASRTIESTTIVGAAGITRTGVRIQGDYELFRNLLLNADFEYTNDNFENIDRTDDITQFRLGGRYMMNRYLHILFGYQYQNRDTSPMSSSGQIYKINELFLRVTGQL